MTHQFQKRIFTPGLFLNDVGFLLIHSPSIVGAAHDQNISRTFVEKIMTVTTAVNECTYCAWYHAKAAVASGIGTEEVKSLLDLQVQATASDFEIMSIAVRAALTPRPIDDLRQELSCPVVPIPTASRSAKHVVLGYSNRCPLATLLWEHAGTQSMSRFKGRPAPESNVAFELAFVLVTFWFMFPAMWLMKTDGKKSAVLTRSEERASGSAQ